MTSVREMDGVSGGEMALITDCTACLMDSMPNKLREGFVSD